MCVVHCSAQLFDLLAGLVETFLVEAQLFDDIGILGFGHPNIQRVDHRMQNAFAFLRRFDSGFNVFEVYFLVTGRALVAAFVVVQQVGKFKRGFDYAHFFLQSIHWIKLCFVAAREERPQLWLGVIVKVFQFAHSCIVFIANFYQTCIVRFQLVKFLAHGFDGAAQLFAANRTAQLFQLSLELFGAAIVILQSVFVFLQRLQIFVLLFQLGFGVLRLAFEFLELLCRLGIKLYLLQQAFEFLSLGLQFGNFFRRGLNRFGSFVQFLLLVAVPPVFIQGVIDIQQVV